jgi:hypothetical protein
MGHQHSVAFRCQQRRDVDVAMDVIGPAMQKDDRRSVGRARYGMADVKDSGRVPA